MNRKTLYFLALRALLGAVSLSALLGIYALLMRDLDEWSAKTLITMILVAGTCVLLMANTSSPHKNAIDYLILGRIGLLAALFALPLSLLGLWFEVDNEQLWKSVITLNITSFFSGHSSVLSRFQSKIRYRYLNPIATTLGAALACLVNWMLWTDNFESLELRVAGIMSILLLSLTIIIPLTAKLLGFNGSRNGKEEIQLIDNSGKTLTS